MIKRLSPFSVGRCLGPSRICSVSWGFANFYRRFIRNFSIIAAPLTSLLREGKHCLVWSTASTEAFQQLKERFTTAPILYHPDPELKFTVEVDASNTGIGAIL